MARSRQKGVAIEYDAELEREGEARLEMEGNHDDPLPAARNADAGTESSGESSGVAFQMSLPYH